MNIVELSVAKCTPSDNGGFVVKLQNKSEKTMDTPLGKKTQVSQQTYYIKLDEQCEVGRKEEFDLDQYMIIERDFTIDDVDSDMHGETIQLKWLSIA